MSEYYDLLEKCERLRQELDEFNRIPGHGYAVIRHAEQALDACKAELRGLEKEMLENLADGGQQ